MASRRGAHLAFHVPNRHGGMKRRITSRLPLESALRKASP